MHPNQFTITLIMLFQLVLLPLALLAWLAFAPAESGIAWLLKAAAVSGAAIALFFLADWTFLSDYGRPLLLLLLAVALLYSGYQMWGQPWWVRPSGWEWARLGVRGLLLAAAVPLVATILQSRRVPGPAVALDFPLRDGVFHVAHGGSRPLTNAHMKVAAPELNAWRGQMWALDVTALYPAGNRARGFFPQELDDYAIFGRPVYAPCAGEAAAIENDLPDLIPPQSDSVNKAGNYVMLRCEQGGYVLLAHLRRGSVTVAPGQQVAAGDLLGQVGNSGNTSEPHLHINAQADLGETTILDAEPRPMLLNGRFPLRNAIFR
jgi:hypothetical protein